MSVNIKLCKKCSPKLAHYHSDGSTCEFGIPKISTIGVLITKVKLKVAMKKVNLTICPIVFDNLCKELGF